VQPWLLTALLVLAMVVGGTTVEATPGPSAPPAGSPRPVGALVPETPTVTIGYADGSLIGRIALVLADAEGYFADAGFTEVRMVPAQEPLPGLLNGDLDFAVLDARQAADANALGLPIEAIAGYRVEPSAAPAPTAAGPAGSIARDLIAATSDTVTSRPGTVTAFTIAYVRALVDMHARYLGAAGVTPSAGASAGPIGAGPAASPGPTTTDHAGASGAPVGPGPYNDRILDLAAGAGIAVPPDVLATWPAALAGFAPFDGGFDEPSVDDGLASLRNLFLADPGSMPDLGRFVSEATLHAAQAALGLPQNPAAGPVAQTAP
jgi:hypothetical protein